MPSGAWTSLSMTLGAEAPTGEFFDEGSDASSKSLELVHKIDDGRFLVRLRLEQHCALGVAHLVQRKAKLSER